jgi:hypothetical protein
MCCKAWATTWGVGPSLNLLPRMFSYLAQISKMIHPVFCRWEAQGTGTLCCKAWATTWRPGQFQIIDQDIEYTLPRYLAYLAQIFKQIHWALCAGERHRDSVLQSLGNNLEAWTIQVKREKGIYHTLNKFSVDVTRKVLVAEAWCPVSGKPRVPQALRAASASSAASVRLSLRPSLLTFSLPLSLYVPVCVRDRKHVCVGGRGLGGGPCACECTCKEGHHVERVHHMGLDVTSLQVHQLHISTNKRCTTSVRGLLRVR